MNTKKTLGLGMIIAFLVFSFVTVSAGCEDDIVGFWKFDEVSGIIAADSSGNDNDGFISGVTLGEVGQVGGAFGYDGFSLDKVTMVSDDWAFTSEDFSVGSWVNLNDVDSRRTLVEFTGGSWQLLYFDEDTGWTFDEEVNQTNTIVQECDFGNYGCSSTVANEWTFVVLTRDDDVWKLYVDGAEIRSAVDDRDLIATDELSVGYGVNYEMNGKFFDGEIDEVAIWSRALSAAEVLEYYLNGVDGHDYCDDCDENVVNGSWSAWEDVSECVDNLIDQSRTRLEYDVNSCGAFVNVTHEETQTVSCGISCEDNVVNGSWSAWENVSECVDNLVDQSRTMLEYDVNSCGTFADVTHVDERSVVCGVDCVEDIVNGSWSAWEDQTECSANLTLVRIRTMLEYDANSCGVFDDVVYTESETVNCSLPVCSVDSDCSDDYYGERYCKGDDVYKDFYDFSCGVGECVENVSEIFVKECKDYCDDGKCGRDDDDDDDEFNNSVNYFVSGDGLTLGLVDVNASGGNIHLEGNKFIDDVGLFWLWILLLIAGIILLLFVIIWAGMD